MRTIKKQEKPVRIAVPDFLFYRGVTVRIIKNDKGEYTPIVEEVKP